MEALHLRQKHSSRAAKHSYNSREINMAVKAAETAVLVSTDWVAEHLDDQTVRLVESNEDQLLYRTGHLPNAIEIDWVDDLNDQLRRDYLDGEAFAALMSRSGISPQTTVVFYGDKSNWWATYAFWVFQLFGHHNARLMDGGRLLWEQQGRPLTREVPSVATTHYPVSQRNDATHRAFRDQVLAHCNARGALIDVRSPDEFSGAKLHMEGYPNEGALRGGHIPGAKNIPWSKAVNPDGTFRSRDELLTLYTGAGFSAQDDIVTYCRIGERSCHTWFVLHHLLGFPKVRNYDGSWTEWGNLVNVPIER